MLKNYNNIFISVFVIAIFIGVVFFLSYYFIESTDNFTNNSKSTYINEKLLWGAYMGDEPDGLSKFENLVEKEVNYQAVFSSFDDFFPVWLTTTVGEEGKTLVIFWEPNFGYDKIIDGSYDNYIKKFADDAKKYMYPIILVPFPEMNINEEAWGYGQNNNTADKFVIAWKHLYDLFQGTTNVKFGIAYNSVSIPEIKGNLLNDYYPGDSYVDYVGVDGFSFKDNWKTFGEIFDEPIHILSSYKKPILIFSMGAEADPKKADWITLGLGKNVKAYDNLVGYIWFNENNTHNWLVNSDNSSLEAFRSVLP